MSGQPTVDLHRFAPEVRPGIRLIPIIHEHVESTPYLRRALDELDPAAVAVELPTPLRECAIQAVRRLPKVSMIISEHPGEEALVWVVTPGDPLTEALRWALERQRSVACIDPDIPYTERHTDPIPDPTMSGWEQ